MSARFQQGENILPRICFYPTTEDMCHLMVVALEFGTTTSAYAFSVKSNFERDPLKIIFPIWKTRTRHSLKTSTCLLLNEKKQFEAFGYDAENRYHELVMDEEQDDYYFFDRFTMSLHNNENVTCDMVLKDKTGKQCSAVEVFTLSIKYLVDHLMNEIDKCGRDFREDDILWVLTVPTAWTDSGKQLMKESAKRAGVHAEKILLITEPEAAFTYCHYIPTTRLQGSKPGIMIKEPGTKSMIVDLGDIAADITILQTTYNGQLKELCRVTGDDCGGTSVDDRFFKMLDEIAGGKLISELKENEIFSYIDLVYFFKIEKRSFRKETKTNVNVIIPLAQINRKCQEFGGKDLQSAIDSSSYVNELTLCGDKLKFKADLFIKLFTPTIDSIITLMKNTVSNRSMNGISNNVSNIVMVGELSECPMIQDAVYKAFPDDQIIIPQDAGLSVMKGAVLFGHRPDYNRSELCDEEGIGK